MSILNRMTRALENSFVNAGRANARRYLLRQSDRVLADGGFSRELLERGNAAWPWRAEGPEAYPLVRARTAGRVVGVSAAPVATLPVPHEPAIVEGGDRQAA